ncbi:hypothetical protein AWB91_09535 [Mycobacterium paraense]|uniref:HTH tetR-type domain-containing protein n=2 Tax=Mycobacterium paraense TaxID=767916 RepID=A0ABX3VRF8_9MYCO|nr:hypothetical protein AWB91_09535 [Mycobacterium paraense]ORW45097.1 hypothetical protein AWB88_04605 [Mycobacterium paraense]
MSMGGPEEIRIELLAQRIGVSKGGFYWHFEDRRALLTAVLDEWERSGFKDIIERIEAEVPSGDPRARLRCMFDLVTASESAELTRAELAIRVWARRATDVAERVHRVDDQRMGYLRSLYSQICESPDDVEARSLLTASVLMGSQLVHTEHGSRTRAEVLRMGFDHLLD